MPTDKLTGFVLSSQKLGRVVHWEALERELKKHGKTYEILIEDAEGHDDTMMDPQQRIWGFETNFGGLADVAMVKANQLMPKPEHLTWEEAASPGLVNCTAYRQLVSANGGNMKQGDNILIFSGDGTFPASGTPQTIALKDNFGVFCSLVKDGLIRHLAGLGRNPPPGAVVVGRQPAVFVRQSRLAEHRSGRCVGLQPGGFLSPGWHPPAKPL